MTRPLSILLAATALAGCAVGPDYKAPQTAGSAAQPFIGQSAAVTAAEPEGEWWRLYADPVLDRLVADALVANKDVAVAIANLAQARAVLREQRAGRLPQTGIDASAQYGRRILGQQQVPGLKREDVIYDAGLSVSYELDLFGRVTRSIEAARGDAEAARGALDATRVAVAAETARAYADAVSSAERLAVAERTLGLLDRTVTLTGKRFEAGRSSRLDVSRASALRDQQRATLPPLRADRAAALFRLATLTGRTPADLPVEATQRTTTLRLAQPIPVGDGRGLLARRPDIREAERRLAAQTARIGVATAALYPTISLGGSIGSTSTSLGDMFTGGPFRWLLGPLLSWAFPNQEANRARIAQADAAARGELARFDQTVLTALQETETALARYSAALQRQQALSDAAAQARTAATITRAQLREGRADFLVVLDAERTSALAEGDLAASDAAVADAQVDLFRALGGGWQTAPEPVLAAR
ncbi:efflux transporter outer membrane subunit [Sphingomonas jatrophae]|uniref:Efflux transporter, outer membrane factor (OMF) lipoprotein, NodT family n=1 Tax=Sphingomonas jatrophae TaxID=1166337 RepID=A0A1I6JS86_9SPHN|nr:efflux transporter outer membrane subunit [Sphingomonas jatrophae]SFR81803.1 efflux transporter, outer membrane factor (OMF) lipoprotein, NodT family [Sphingomonas jatrophae]